MRYLLIFVLIISLATACNNSNEQASDKHNALDNVMDKVSSGDNSNQGQMQGQAVTSINRAKVVESEDAGTYTYVKLEENGKQFWAAITARPIRIGQEYAYSNGLMMKDFESKQLGRTFDSVLFIQNFTLANARSEAKKSSGENKSVSQSDPHSHTTTQQHKSIEVEPASGGETIASIYGNLDELKGAEVTIRGQVVKISKNIMNRNWIHIQDGTKSGNHYDLTVTTYQPVTFEVGDIVTFTGVLSVDKDFGAGYLYDAILEDASVQKSTHL